MKQGLFPEAFRGRMGTSSSGGTAEGDPVLSNTEWLQGLWKLGLDLSCQGDGLKAAKCSSATTNANVNQSEM